MAVSERLAIVIDANGEKAVAAFNKVGAAAKNLGGPVGQAGGIMSKFSGTLGGLAGIAGPAALLALGGALVKFGQSGVSAFMDLTSEVKKFRLVVGGSAEDASKLLFALKAVGVDADSAASSIGMFEKRVGSGAANLDRYGIVVVKNSHGITNMSATLGNAADAFAHTSDPIARATMGSELFGRQWQTLLPLLARGKDGIKALTDEAEKHHLIVSDEDIANAGELKVAMRNLDDAVKGIQVSAGRGLVPAVTEVVTLIDKALQRADELQHGPSSDAKGGWWDKFTSLMAQGGKIWDDALKQLPTLAHEADKTAASYVQLGIDAAEAGKAIFPMIESDRALASAHRSLDGAQRTLTADQKAYSALLKQGAVDTEKVADAQRSLASATRSVGHARREQTRAQEDYNDAAAAAGILGTDTAMDKKQEAADHLADANDSVASSLEAQANAARDLAKAKAGDPQYQEKLAAALAKVGDDTQAIADAEYRLGQQAVANAPLHDAETRAIAGKADVLERFIADMKAMIALHPDMAGALQPAIDAAMAGLPLTGFKPQPPGVAGPPQAIYGSGIYGSGGSAPAYSGPITAFNPLPTGVAGPPQASYGSDPKTVTNQTINVYVDSPQNADPAGLARNILWSIQ